MKRLLRSLILLIVRMLGWPGVRFNSTRARTTNNPRILLVRPDHLGDLILVTPVIQALRERVPEANITLLVGPWSREIVERHPAVDHVEICAFPGFQRAPQRALAPYRLLWAMARQFGQKNYDFDLAINLRPDFWWGAALLYLAGIPRRVGYALQPGQPFLNHTLPFPPHEHATISNLRLVSAGLTTLGYEPLSEPFTPERYPARFTPTAEEQTWAAQRLQAEGIPVDTPLIIIPPGSGGAVKLWRTESWARCANTLCTTLTATTRARIMLTGSPAERALVEEVAHEITPTPVLVTDASIGQLAALLARATVVLTVDNGPGHIAAAQDTPSVHLFGPTDPHIFGPWGSEERHLVLAATERCQSCPAIPCGRLDFSDDELPAHPCVRNISVERMLAGAHKVLTATSVQTAQSTLE
jgi:ADP-heptose:LPS heptosyltransferase